MNSSEKSTLLHLSMCVSVSTQSVKELSTAYGIANNGYTIGLHRYVLNKLTEDLINCAQLVIKCFEVYGERKREDNMFHLQRRVYEKGEI